MRCRACSRPFRSRRSHPAEGQTRPDLSGLDVQRHDPFMLADLARSLEAEPLEHVQGSIEEEGSRGLPSFDILGISLDAPAAKRSDLLDRTCERGRRNAVTAMALAREETGNPPIGQLRVSLW